MQPMAEGCLYQKRCGARNVSRMCTGLNTCQPNNTSLSLKYKFRNETHAPLSSEKIQIIVTSLGNAIELSTMQEITMM